MNYKSLKNKCYKKKIAPLYGMLAAASVFLCACGAGGTVQQTKVQSTKESRVTETTAQTENVDITSAAASEKSVLKMMIADTPVTVEWEDNEAVSALKELVKDEALVVQMSMYGGFEQVGSLGKSLPREDTQTTTQAGDIVLYSGDQIVVFYGANSWDYTRLGRITDKTEQEMRELLSNGDVTVTISRDGKVPD